VNSLQLPQNLSGANFPVSDDYGSQSEGTVQLSGNGKYLTMIGYGLNAAIFNVNYLNYCPGSTMLSNACVPENGNPAMAQTGTLLGQTYSGNTPVPRVAVLIDANGNVNSSTVLYGIFNQNDARSAYSPDGVNIYVSGQGCKTWDASDNLCDNSATLYDNTQGVYLTTLGANNYFGTNNPIAITGPDNGPEPCSSLTTCTESQSTRMVQIYNNTLYVSTDDKGGNNRAYIGTLGDPAATSLFECNGGSNGGPCGTGYGPYGPAEIPGLVNTGGTGKYTINTQGSGNTSNGNNLNAGLAVNLSPQNFWFASPTVLYVADTGSPKNHSNGPDAVCTTDGTTDSATVGDGGLQKWILNPTVTVTLTSGSKTASASSGAFTQGEVGLPISGTGIPAGTTITAVSSAGANATLSANATVSHSESVTVSGWSLAYTLYNGLNLVLNSDCDPSSPTTPQSLATTGLYGVTGTVNNGVATLYVTTYPNNDLVQTYLYGITDTLTTTTISTTNNPSPAFTLLDTAPAGSILRGVTFVPKFQNGDVAITTVPSGLTVTSAGAGCAPSTFTTPLTLAWTPTNTCTLSVVSPQAGPTGIQYALANWQDGTTGLTDTVTAPSSTATNTYTYTATFTTQYQLTTSAGTGGSVSAGGYYAAGTNATITATPSAGYYFVNFTGATTSTSNPLVLPMTAPQSITANFAAQGPQTITFNPLSNQVLGAPQFPVSATASSNLTVSFASLTTSVCTVLGPSPASVTLVTAGVCTIQATQAGGGDYTAASPVNQSFEVTSPGLATSTLLFGSAGGSSSVVLAYGGSWTASTNASFLTISAGSAGGTGNALVEFTVSPFAGAGSRTGTLTIAGFTLSVTQAGTNYLGPSPVTTLVYGLNTPIGTAVDGSGNVYFSDSTLNLIEEWNAATQMVTTLVSGLSSPSGVAVDGSGNVYFADSGNNAIKEWNASTQMVSTLVSGLSGPSGVAVDGVGDVYFADSGNMAIKEWNVATQTVTTLDSMGLSNPSGVAVDGDGNVYFSDSALNEVNEWNAATQMVTTLAPSSSGLNGPTGVAVDGSGNVYISDTGNNAIKEYSASLQTVTTLVSTGLSGPSGVAVDGFGDVYFADTGNYAIEVILNAYVGPASGLNEPAAAGSDQLLPVLPATAPLTGIFAPTSNQGWLTIGAIAGAVVNFSFTANTTTSSLAASISILGQAISVTQSGLLTQTINFSPLSSSYAYGAQPSLSATASSNLTVSFNSQTITVCTVSGTTVTLVGLGTCTIQATQSGNAIYAAAPSVSQNFLVTQEGQTITFGALANQPLNAAQFALSASASSGLAVSFASLTMPVCTVSGATVTLVTLGVCTIQATQGGGGDYLPSAPVSQSFEVTSSGIATNALLLGSAGGSSSVVLAYSGAWTAGSNASFLHISAGSAGTGNGLVEFTIDPFAGTGSRTGTLTIAGSTLTVTQAGTNYIGPSPVTTLVSGLNSPSGTAVDGSGNVYFSDSVLNLVEKWTAATQMVSTLVSGLSKPSGVAVDGSGNVYFADSGNNAIKEWNASTQMVSTLASGLNNPSGVAVDGVGNVYFADSGNQAIKEWNLATQAVATLVSSGLGNPSGVAVDLDGNVYFSDLGNNVVQEWNAATQMVSTLVPSGLNGPTGTAVDGSGNVYFSDSGNQAIKEWSASTQAVTTLVSTGLSGPSGVAVDGSGDVYFADTGNQAIKAILNAYVGPAGGFTEPAMAGTGALLPVLPATGSLTGIFAPTSNQSWLAIGTIASGVVNFSLNGNLTTSARAANINILGQSISVTQAGRLAGAPTVVSLSPTSGTGLTQTFTAVYSDPNGVSDLSGVVVLFNNSVSVSNDCAVVYVPGTNLMYLYNNAGTSLSTGIAPGSSGLVSNSQCTLAGSGSSFSTSGNNLTLSVALTFTGTFVGQKDVFLYAAGETSNSGWVQKGTWLPSSAGAPTVASLSPSSGTGLTQTFTAAYSDPNGTADLSGVVVLFNNSVSVSNGCAVIYVPASNLMYLYNNAGTALSTGVAPGSSGSVSNSQCTLAGTGSSFNASGDNLTLNVALTFTGTFLGQKDVFLYAAGETSNSGWVQKGTWLPASAGPPTVVSLSPGLGSGLTQTFTMAYSDPNGIADLSDVVALFNTSVNPANACAVVYIPASNLLYLYNNAGTALTTGVTPGSSGSVSNSQCTLAGAGSSVNTSGNNLTLNVALTFSGTFVGEKYVVLDAVGKTQSSGWVQKGTWTP
jgi:streptogramin lyase